MGMMMMMMAAAAMRAKQELAGVDVNVDGEDEDSIKCKEDESVNGDRLAVGLHAPELKIFVVARELKQQARLQQYKQNHPD